VDFRNVNDANLALNALHNHPFDAKHLFKVNRFTDIERFTSLDETYAEPELEEYTPRVRWFPSSSLVTDGRCEQEHLRAWLADPQGRDQYVTYRGEDVEIYWHGKPSQCEIAYKPVSITFICRVRRSNLSFFRNGRISCMLPGHPSAPTLQPCIDKACVCGEVLHGSPNNDLLTLS